MRIAKVLRCYAVLECKNGHSQEQKYPSAGQGDSSTALLRILHGQRNGHATSETVSHSVFVMKAHLLAFPSSLNRKQARTAVKRKVAAEKDEAFPWAAARTLIEAVGCIWGPRARDAANSPASSSSPAASTQVAPGPSTS